MEELRWILENWFTVLSAVGVIGGLFFTAFSIRSETRTRKISNLIALTANHREVWKQLIQRPELGRVVDSSAEAIKQPVTPDEEAFVSLVVIHTSSVYEALKDELVIKQEGLRQDVGSFFSLPIPRAIWERIKSVQNEDFVAFVETCRTGGAVVIKVVAVIGGLAQRSLGLETVHASNGCRFVVVRPCGAAEKRTKAVRFEYVDPPRKVSGGIRGVESPECGGLGCLKPVLYCRRESGEEIEARFRLQFAHSDDVIF